MKRTFLMPPLALGAATLAALFVSGCGAGNSNNPNVTQVSTTTTTATTTTQTTSEIVYVADAGYEDEIRGLKIKVKPRATGKINGNTPALEAYSITITSGVPTVTELNSVSANYGLSSIAIDPTHRYLFALTDPDSPEVDVYSLNGDGSIGAQVATGLVLSDFSEDDHELAVVAPPGAGGAEYVYVAGGSAGALYGFKFSGGSLTNLNLTAPSSDAPYSLATDPTGTYLYSGGISGFPEITPYVITASTGAVTPTTQAVAGTHGDILVATDPAGSYVYGYELGVNLQAYQRGSGGALTPDGSSQPTSINGSDLAITPSGNALFVANGDSGTITEVTTNSNGSLNAPTTTAQIQGSALYGIAVDATGSYVGTLDLYNDALVIYPLNGTTLGAPQSFFLDDAITPFSAVFVPSSSATASARKK